MVDRDEQGGPDGAGHQATRGRGHRVVAVAGQHDGGPRLDQDLRRLPGHGQVQVLFQEASGSDRSRLGAAMAGIQDHMGPPDRDAKVDDLDGLARGAHQPAVTPSVDHGKGDAGR